MLFWLRPSLFTTLLVGTSALLAAAGGTAAAGATLLTAYMLHKVASKNSKIFSATPQPPPKYTLALTPMIEAAPPRQPWPDRRRRRAHAHEREAHARSMELDSSEQESSQDYSDYRYGDGSREQRTAEGWAHPRACSRTGSDGGMHGTEEEDMLLYSSAGSGPRVRPDRGGDAVQRGVVQEEGEEVTVPGETGTPLARAP